MSLLNRLRLLFLLQAEKKKKEPPISFTVAPSIPKNKKKSPVPPDEYNDLLTEGQEVDSWDILLEDVRTRELMRNHLEICFLDDA